MSSKRSLYVVPKTLDAPTRLVGLPLDEFIPAIALAGFFFVMGRLLLALAVPAVLVVFLKLIKRGQGRSWLLNIGYWYLPKRVMQILLRQTPPSYQRDYIA